MDFSLALVVLGLTGFIVAAGLVAFNRKRVQSAFDQAQVESRKILEEARKDAEKILRSAASDAKNEARDRRNKFEEETKNRRAELAKLENKIKQREQNLDKKFEIVSKRETEIDQSQQQLREEDARYKRLMVECEKTLDQSRRTLQNIAGMSPEEAKRELIRSLEDEAKKEAQGRIRAIEEEARREAEERARSMVSLAVQRVSSEYVNEATVSVVSIPSDEMKGRIIGREGRNIRAIETATGVDLIIDDTPEAVIISCFNPVRREIAKIAIGRLVADGRVHPARIDETVKRVREEFDQILLETGEQASFEIGITDLHPELLKALGRLKFRTAGQQSVLQHSIEVAQICGVMASEMGLNIKKAKRCGLLHDVGKSVDQEIEGHHAQVGADLCAKYGEAKEICSAIADHHLDDVRNLSPFGVLLHAANHLSANRPGARKDQIETYVKRLNDIEAAVMKFPTVSEVFVMQAGREIRAMVAPSGVSDSEIVDLAQDVANKLRSDLTFPGQIRVTVLRESRQLDYAK